MEGKALVGAPPLWIRRFDLLPREQVQNHHHPFDHISILASGQAEVKIDDRVTQLEGPTELVIPKTARHTITAITACTWYCVFPEDIAPYGSTGGPN